MPSIAQRSESVVADLVNMLGPLAGAQIPGGCDYCDARQTIEPITAGAWSIRRAPQRLVPVVALQRQRRHR